MPETERGATTDPRTPRSLPTPSAALSWLLSPATGEATRAQAGVLAAVRVLVGLMWLFNVVWKRPPDFGRESGQDLFKFTSYAVSHPVLPPYSWVVEHLVVPNLAVFGWGVLAAETALAVLLLSGAYVRIAAVLGLAQSVAIGLSVAYAPDEWPWSYLLMVGVHALLLVSPAGNALAVDNLRAGLGGRRALLRTWGAVAVVVGLVSAVRSLGDPLASRGPHFGSFDIEMSLGSYNLLGAVVLLAAGLLLLAAAGRRLAVAAPVAAGLSVLAALSLYAQIGFSSPLLGGTATSAALLLTLAVVAMAGRSVAPSPAATTETTVTTASEPPR